MTLSLSTIEVSFPYLNCAVSVMNEAFVEKVLILILILIKCLEMAISILYIQN